MGVVAGWTPGNGTRIGVVFLIAMLAAVSVPAIASVYDYSYGSVTGTVRTPSVTLGGGTAGVSAVSPVAADAATATTTAGLEFYETAALPEATPVIDGSIGQAFTSSPGSTGGGNRLSTSASPDLIYVLISIHGGQTVSSITDGSGLTYTFRQGVSQGANVRVETWYAVASTTLRRDVITVTLSGSTRFVISALAINGVNTVTPFDPGVSAAATGSGTGTTASAPVTTLYPNDVLIGGAAVQAAPSLTAGTGFTLNQVFTGGLLTGADEYDHVTSVQTALGVQVTWTGAQNWAFIADAVVADQSSTSSDTSITPPGAGTSTAIPAGTSAFLWSPPFTVGSTLYSANWLLDMWASRATSAGTIEASIYIVNSADAILATVASQSVTSSIGTAESEVQSTIVGSGATIPANGQILMVLTNPLGGTTVTVYWGTGQLSNFQTPNTYNYVLSLSNPGSAAWNVNLATTAGQTSNLGRLTSTISFVSPSSNQIVITGGSLAQASGAQVSLAASGTLSIQVVATANAIPTSSNVPSTITFSIRVTSTTSTAFSQYTVVLTID